MFSIAYLKFARRIRGTAAFVVAIATTAALPFTATSQPSVTVDAAVASAFVWRGIHFTNRPVVQADFTLTQSVRAVTFSGGAWVNSEPVNYESAKVLHMLAPGNAGPAVTAVTTWIDATATKGALVLTTGITQYQYPKRTGFAEAFNTSEVYVRAAVGGLLSPRVQVWWDIQKIRGAYLEAALAHTFETKLPISTTLTAGWSAGQEAKGTQSYYFNKSGLASLDGGLGISLSRGSLTLTPSIHGVLARDPSTKLVTPGAALENTKLWWIVGGSWSR